MIFKRDEDEADAIEATGPGRAHQGTEGSRHGGQQ